MRPSDHGAGGASRDTRIEGRHGQIETAAQWLRTTAKSGATTFGDAAYDARSAVGSAWRDEAGDGFHNEATKLGKAADDVSSAAETAAG